MNNKGLSQIVIFTFVIILSFLCVIIFWNILGPFIKETSEQIELEALIESLEIQEAKKAVRTEEQQFKTTACVPNWKCGDWSKCEVSYNLNDLIGEEIMLEGERQRECEDLNNCLPNKIETESCDTKVSIKVERVFKCDKEYLEIRDQNRVLISRIEIRDNGLNIQLLLGETEYCPHCYDGIKNYNEDEIDCVYGENGCPVC